MNDQEFDNKLVLVLGFWRILNHHIYKAEHISTCYLMWCGDILPFQNTVTVTIESLHENSCA